MQYVLSINEGGSDNLGDQAISESLETILRNQNCLVETYNFTRVKRVANFNIAQKELKNNFNQLKQKTSYLKGFLAKSSFLRQMRWIQLHIGKIIRVAKKRYDIAFIGGGQLVLSNIIFPIAMFAWVVILRLFRTKVVVIGVGSGSNFNFSDKLLYKIALSLCSEVLLRDNASIQQVKKSFGVKANFIPDLAFCYSKILTRNNLTKQKKLLVGIIEYPVFVKYSKEVGNTICTEEEYIKLWVNNILSLDFEIGEIILVSTTSEDLIYSKKLYNQLKELNLKSELNFISKVLDLNKYIKLIKDSDAIISARMHSLILAQLQGCIIFPWKVSKKIESYEKEYLNQALPNVQSKIKDTVSLLLKKYNK